MPVFDLHCDTLTAFMSPLRCRDTLNDPCSAFALSKVQTIPWCQCCAVFVPDGLTPQEALGYYRYHRDSFQRQVQDCQGQALACATAREVSATWEQKKTALVLTVENGSLLGAGLEHVEELRRDTALFEEFAAFLDRLFQSDRIGFGAIALLPVRKRILLWALSWGITYGDLVTEGGVEWLEIEPSLSALLLSRVASANLSQIKRDLAQMRREEIYKRDGARLLVRADALDDVWRWLRDSEERTARFKRPVDWRGYCRDYPKIPLP